MSKRSIQGKKSSKKTTTKKRKKPSKKMSYFDQLEAEGKVLCPKVGKEKEFEEAFNQAIQIGQGALGWEGHSEMMASILDPKEATKQFGIKLSKDHNKRRDILKQVIIKAHMDSIMENADWLTEKEADNRNEYRNILYKELNDDGQNSKK